MNGFLSALFWGVVSLSILVVVHEGGHFLASRTLGVRVTEFFIGMPCRVRISRKSRKYGTEFGVTPLLLGGYNRICGMEVEVPSDEVLAPVLSCVQSHGRVRVTDLAHELAIEEEQAYGALATLVDWACIRPYFDPELGESPTQKEWPAAFQTIARDPNHYSEYDREHDFELEGTTGEAEPHPIGDAQAFLEAERRRTYAGKGLFGRLAILLAGPVVNIILAFALVAGSLMLAGVDYAINSSTLGSVVEGSYAQAAGLAAGDTITKIGSDDIEDWNGIVDALEPYLSEGIDVPIVYERDGKAYETVVDIPDGEPCKAIGVGILHETYHYPPLEALGAAAMYMTTVATYVFRLIVPSHTVEILSQSSSVVGISAMASEAVSSGPNSWVLFLAAVSMSLGFMNLLPIAPLDGGKILIAILERIIGRPLSMRAQNAIAYVGLAFILFIFVFALRNDLVRILG